MQQSKLVRTIQQLQPDEFTELKLYVKDQCKNKKCVQLIDLIGKHYPSRLESPALNKRDVYKKLFPGENYNDNKMLKLMSELYRFFELFVIDASARNDYPVQKIALIRFYLNHALYSQIPQEIRELTAYLDSEKISANTFLYRYFLEEARIVLQEKENNRYISYQALHDALQEFTGTSLIRLQNLNLINLKNDMQDTAPRNPVFLIHSGLYKLLTTDDEKNYPKYFALVKKHQNKLEGKELKTCVIILADYCIKKVNAHKAVFNKHLFDLFKLLIDHHLILEEDNTITPAIYKNIITIGLRLGKTEFTEKFLEDHKNFLPAENREDLYLYNKANLLFYRGQYEAVLTDLRSSKFRDIFYKLSARRLQIKALYSLLPKDRTYYETLSNMLNAFKKFVYVNEEATELYKAGNRNFIKYMNKLLELRPKADAEINNFLRELEQAGQVAEYEWLREIASKMQKKPANRN